MRYILIIISAITTNLYAGAADDSHIPLYYVEVEPDREGEAYPVYDISPALGTVLTEIDGEKVWIEGARVVPGKGGAVVAVLEGTAPDADWAIMGNGAIPYRRSDKYAWFARAAFEADLEPFFPGDEIIGLVEKHKLYKGGIISTDAESYIAVIDDDFIGEICRSITYDTYNSARGYNQVSLNLLKGDQENLLIIEDTTCEFRVSSYDWRRSGIADFFRYRNGELRRDGFTIAAIEVSTEGLIGGVTSDFAFYDDGRFYQNRTAYVEIPARSERFESVYSIKLETAGKRIDLGNRHFDDMVEGITKSETGIYKIPGTAAGPIDTIVADTPLDLHVYWQNPVCFDTDWYLAESKETIEGRKRIGWVLAKEINLTE